MTSLVKQPFCNHRRWREFIAAIHDTPYSEHPVSRAAPEMSAASSANWLSPRSDAELGWEPLEA